MTTQPKIKPICAYCGCDEIALDVTASWNVETQRAEADDIMDKGHFCPDCDGETRIDWVEA